MTRSGRRGMLSPGEMFPAGDPAYRVSYPRLASGIKIRVVERGVPDSPPVVLVHGWGCSAYVFRQNMPALADGGFRAIAFDLKGHGLSDKPQTADGYTVDAMVEHLREVLDALGLQQPALVGHSLGGSLIYHFAGKYPERVRALCLISPAGLTGVPRMRMYRFLTPSALTPLFRRFRSRTLVKAALMRVYGKRGHFTTRDVEEYVAPSQFPEFGPAVRHLLHSYDWRAAESRDLPIVQLPAAGVWGSLDHMMPADAMAIYSRLLPGIVLHAVPDAGHVVAEETPREVNEVLLALLRQVYFP